MTAPDRPTALVTGVAGDIGVAVVRALQSHDMRVLGTDISDAAIPMDRFDHVDLSDLSHVEQYAAELTELEGGIDHIIHVAAAVKKAPLAELEPADWSRIMNVNVIAPALLARALAPDMAAGSTITLIGSIRAQRGFREDSAYTASKGAVEALARALAVELAPRTRVNVVSPGAIDTAMNAAVLADPAKRADVIQRIPTGRLGSPEDVAATVLFLVSAGTSYITGQILTVDGGMSIQGA